MTPNIKITYFNVRALVESTRMMLKYGGIDFVDERFEDDEWPKYKPDTPFGQSPTLVENGKMAHQSMAIARYAAKKVKLVGSNDWENLEIDAMVDTISDFKSKIQQYYYEKDATVKETLKGVLLKETIPFYLDKFEAIAKENKGHFAIGKLTWADFFFVGLLDYLNHMISMNLIENRPNLKKVVENVVSIPTVQAWIKTRPKNDY